MSKPIFTITAPLFDGNDDYLKDLYSMAERLSSDYYVIVFTSTEIHHPIYQAFFEKDFNEAEYACILKDITTHIDKHKAELVKL